MNPIEDNATQSNRKPRVAVIMSAYNGEHYIEEQINSIVRQDGVDVELLVRDDGSTDNTVSIVEGLSVYDERISIDKGKNIGYRLSFMQALTDSSDADYYAFSDQDDSWDPDKLLCAIRSLRRVEQRNEPAVYYSNLVIANQDLVPIATTELQHRNRSLQSVIMRRSIAGCTMVVNRPLKCLICACPPDSLALRNGHDSFVISLCYAVGGKVVFDDAAHMRYRQHSGQASGGAPRAFVSRFKKEFGFLSESRGAERDLAIWMLNNWSEKLTVDAVKTFETVVAASHDLRARAEIVLSRQYCTGNIALSFVGKVKAAFGWL